MQAPACSLFTRMTETCTYLLSLRALEPHSTVEIDPHTSTQLPVGGCATMLLMNQSLSAVNEH